MLNFKLPLFLQIFLDKYFFEKYVEIKMSIMRKSEEEREGRMRSRSKDQMQPSSRVPKMKYKK